MSIIELQGLKTVPDVIHEYNAATKRNQTPLIIDNGKYNRVCFCSGYRLTNKILSRFIRVSRWLGIQWKTNDDLSEFDCTATQRKSEKRWWTSAHSTNSNWKWYCEYRSDAIPTPYPSLFAIYFILIDEMHWYPFNLLTQTIAIACSLIEMLSLIITIKNKFLMIYSSIWQLILITVWIIRLCWPNVWRIRTTVDNVKIEFLFGNFMKWYISLKFMPFQSCLSYYLNVMMCPEFAMELIHFWVSLTTASVRMDWSFQLATIRSI